MQKILLYYKFVPLADPEAVMLWQRLLCDQLHLRGRIIISAKGLNGTVGGEVEDLKAYVKVTKSFAAFKSMEFKWSEGSRDDFPKLSVKVRTETVTLGIPEDIKVNDKGIVNGGTRIRPADLDEFMAANPDAVFFDGRNNYESAIGKFKGAITPNVATFKEFPAELDKPQYQQLKDKKVVTYCTGDIRCEVLSAVMKQKGFQNVYQLDGGIVRYGQTSKTRGLWQGKCYVFDRRQHIAFAQDDADIAVCGFCQSPTSTYMNCANNLCNRMVLVCENCSQTREECGQCILESPKITTN